MLSEKEKEKDVREFARFLDGVNPSDFEYAIDPMELLATSRNPADWHEAVDSIEAFLLLGGSDRDALMKVLPAAVNLASNNHLDPRACDALMRLAARRYDRLFLPLAGNWSLSTQQYLFLARNESTAVRMALAQNPVVGPPVLEVLLKDEVGVVVLAALDNRHCSLALQRQAKPEMQQEHSRLKAMAVIEIRNARTEADFRKCFESDPKFDERLNEAYANNPYTPQGLIRRIARTGSIAGEIATINLANEYYRFQQKK